MRLKTLTASILLVLIGGCSTVQINPVKPVSTFCGRLGGLATDHAGALARDGGPESKRTGVRLISAIDGGCEVTA